MPRRKVAGCDLALHRPGRALWWLRDRVCLVDRVCCLAALQAVGLLMDFDELDEDQVFIVNDFIADNGGEVELMCYDCCARNFDGGNGSIDCIIGLAPSGAMCEVCGS